jgi:hypothetical protein
MGVRSKRPYAGDYSAVFGVRASGIAAVAAKANTGAKRKTGPQRWSDRNNPPLNRRQLLRVPGPRPINELC